MFRLSYGNKAFWKNTCAHHVHPPSRKPSLSSSMFPAIPRILASAGPCSMRIGRSSNHLKMQLEDMSLIKWNKLNTMTRYAAISSIIYVFTKRSPRVLGRPKYSSKNLYFMDVYSRPCQVSVGLVPKMSLDLLVDSTNAIVLGCKSWENNRGSNGYTPHVFYQLLTYQSVLLKNQPRQMGRPDQYCMLEKDLFAK